MYRHLVLVAVLSLCGCSGSPAGAAATKASTSKTAGASSLPSPSSTMQAVKLAPECVGDNTQFLTDSVFTKIHASGLDVTFESDAFTPEGVVMVPLNADIQFTATFTSKDGSIHQGVANVLCSPRVGQGKTPIQVSFHILDDCSLFQ